MLTQDQFQRISQTLPFIRRAEPALARDFQHTAYFARIPAGRDIFVEGDDTSAIALLIAGVVRVYKIGESGREITLYRFGSGESCIMSANAILNQHAFPAIATVEADAEAIMIPAAAFRDWVGRYDLWRAFVFDLLSQRLSRIMTLVDEVTFRRVDARIAALLLERSQQQNPIIITHQEIAAELGSSREVVSRLIKGFADTGLIRTTRGQIKILDTESLHLRALM